MKPQHSLATAPAFTLIELLLSVAIFAFISSLAMISLASTIRMQSVTRQNHGIALQSDRILEAIGEDVRNSITIPYRGDMDGVVILAADPSQTTPCGSGSGACYQGDDILIVTVFQKDADGRPTATEDRHVYCSEPILGTSGTQIAKQLVRFTTTPGKITFQGPVICTQAGMAALFRGATVSKEVLSDPTFDVLNLRFWPLWTEHTAEYVSYNPYGVRIEMMAKYTTKISNPTSEDRVSDTQVNAPQITKRLEVFRNQR